MFTSVVAVMAHSAGFDFMNEKNYHAKKKEYKPWPRFITLEIGLS